MLRRGIAFLPLSTSLRKKQLGRKKREVLAQMGLHLGSEVPGWPPENIEALADAYPTRIGA